MAFGWPTRYIQLDMVSVGGSEAWDRGVHDANKVYRRRVVGAFSRIPCRLTQGCWALFLAFSFSSASLSSITCS